MAIEFELPKSLPIFRVSAPQVNLTRLYEVAGALFGVDEFSAGSVEHVKSWSQD